MNILENQHPISSSNNQCKKTFLINEIHQMKNIKNIYFDLLENLQNIIKDINQLDQEKVNNFNINQRKNQKCNELINNKESQLVFINNNIDKMIKFIKQKKSQYSSVAVTKNILKYLELQKQGNHSYTQFIENYRQFIKRQQTLINNRQNQLQQFQQLKNIQTFRQKNLNIQLDLQQLLKRTSKPKWKQSTQKTIQTFDFNHKLLDVIKNQMIILKLKKRKLEKVYEERKNAKTAQEKGFKQQINTNIDELLNLDNCLTGNIPRFKSQFYFEKKKLGAFSEDSQSTRLPKTLNGTNQILLKSLSRNSIMMKKNEVTGFQKIVLVYLKQKYINDQLQTKINELKKKSNNKKTLNSLLKQKTIMLDKQIQKIQWNSVCDQSLFMSIDKKQKRNKIQQVQPQLSLLDRTNFQQSDQRSQQYSQFSINQSIIS